MRHQDPSEIMNMDIISALCTVEGNFFSHCYQSLLYAKLLLIFWSIYVSS